MIDEACKRVFDMIDQVNTLGEANYQVMRTFLLMKKKNKNIFLWTARPPQVNSVPAILI